MSAHTPGPWTSRGTHVFPAAHAERRIGGSTSRRENVEEFAHVVARIEADASRFRAAQVVANARLISAAPELLEAAQKALSECCDLIATPAGDALADAIFKATGVKP